MAQDYVIADIGLADWGRKELSIAETEMPGLMALRDEFGSDKPLAGARIAGCLHMTVQTAVLIETLVALGADVRWSSCNIFSTQDHAASAIAKSGVPVFAIKGETLAEYWEYVDRTFDWPNEQTANLILDDGGDATMYILLGARAEAGEDVLAVPTSEEEEVIKKQIQKRIAETPGWFAKTKADIKGVSEETTTGVHRLYELQRDGQLPFPAINVNDSVTKSKFDNKYGCKESLVDGIRRATDTMMAGKVAVVMGYGDVGKGSAQSLRQEGMIVRVTEVDPICAMQACMDGYEVVSPYVGGKNTGKVADIDLRLLQDTDIVVTCTGNANVCDEAILRTVKAGAVICNIGHFDNEIDTAFMRENWTWDKVKDQVHMIHRSETRGDSLILLSEGRLVNLGNAMGHPSRIMDGSFANQVLAQMYLFEQAWSDQPINQRQPVGVEVLPKKLDEEVAELMVAGFGGVMTRLTKYQADYIGVGEEGPFKIDSYKY